MKKIISISILVAFVVAIVLAVTLSINGRYEKIPGRSNDEVAKNFLVENRDMREGQQIIETEKRPIDGWTSYSYVLEDEDGELTYIDNAIVLPDDGNTYHDLETDNLVSDYKVDVALAQDGVGTSETNVNPLDEDGYIKEEYRGTAYGDMLVEFDGEKFRP